MTSLADRISKPESEVKDPDGPKSPGPVKDAKPAEPTESSSWADETTSAAAASSAPPAVKSKAETEMSSLAAAQTDGATSEANGGSGIVDSTYDVDIKLADIQANPNDPLYSVKSFEQLGIDERILKGIYQMRFSKPSKIQERALPLLLNNPPVNFIGQSQSGTGKTAAFVLNMLHRLDLSKQTPQALVLAPSRELARQILGVVQVMGEFLTGLEVEAAIPVSEKDKGRKLTGHVVVGTPGTTMTLIQRRQLNAQSIKVLVLDEADNMLDQSGLGDQCQRVRRLLPNNTQIVLFSATFPDAVTTFAGKFAPNANQITLKHEELTVEGIKQLVLECDNDTDKYDALVHLYGLMTIGSSIIFTRTKATAMEIERRLNAEGHQVACLTGEFTPEQRDIIIDSFRMGQTKVLIATNVISRGIDVQTVSLVINYDLPDDGRGHAEPQVYLHRIGRTGRFGRVGVSISLTAGRQAQMMIREIEGYFGIQMVPLPRDDWDETEKIVKKVIKSSRATADYGMADSQDIQM